MTWGLIADAHLHPWSSFSTVHPDGINSRLQGLLNEIARCAKEVHDEGGRYVVFAGDVFHVRGSVAPTVLNATRDALRAISERYGTEFIIIPGNHDLEGKHSTRLSSAVTALESPFVSVLNAPERVLNLGIVVIPWIEDIAELKKELEKHAGPHDVVIHAPIDGVIPGLPCHGLDPVYLAGLGYRNIFAGHYHHHKAFPGNVVSIGSLAHHTWSEAGSKSGFLLVNEDDGRYRWFKSALPEFIDLTKLATVEPEDLPLVVDGNFIRMRVAVTKSADVEKARQELLSMGARAVLIQPEPKKTTEGRADAGASVKTGSSLELSVTEYVKGAGMPADVSKEALDVLNSVDLDK